MPGSAEFDPKGFVQVIDVTRGFTPQEWNNGEHEPYFATRRALGRAWKAHNGGIGSDLNTMIFRKHKGQPPAKQRAAAPDPKRKQTP